MESDVTQTLGELERKLKELERELESVGRGGETDADPAQAGWEPPPEAPAPPAGVTPFTAQWHGSGPPPDAPPPAYNGAPPAVPVAPPTAVWSPPPAPEPAPPAPASAPPSLHAQLDELLAFRERLVRSTNELVDELSRVLADLGADVAPPPPGPDEVVFHGPVTIEAGPFADLTTLAAFEQAIARADGVTQVAVRALDTGHATIDLTLGEPVALGRALRQTAPVPFTLAVAGERLVHLTLAPAGPPG